MLVPDHKSTRTRRRVGRGLAITASSLAVGLGVVSPAAASAADRTTARPFADSAAESAAAVAPTPFTTAMRSARTGLTTAVVYLTNHQSNFAITALRNLNTQLATVHKLGTTNMGPIKAVKAFGLEHDIAMKLLPYFNGLTNATLTNALQATLTTTFANRTAMLNKIIALPAEGPVDYDDALADKLPLYAAEVTKYTAALSQFQLSAQARTALTNDLALVKATRQKYTARFGGGE